jgi:hypothetical protein
MTWRRQMQSQKSEIGKRNEEIFEVKEKGEYMESYTNAEVMNKQSEHIGHWFWKTARLLAVILAPVFVTGCSLKSPPASPIPKGQAGIHVEFKGLSTDQFNELTAFVKKLAEYHSAYVEGSTSERDVGDYSTYHGFWNDGFVAQTYKPNHPIPSPQVEAAMKEQLESFLKKNKIDAGSVKLELRYGR